MRQVHARRVARRLDRRRAMKVAPFSSITASLLNVPRRSFGPCRSARMPIGRPDSFSTARIAAMSSRIASCGVWLMLMRKTSAPACEQARDRRLIGGRRPEGRDDLGAAQASHLVCFGWARRAPPGGQWRILRQRLLRRLLGRFGELHGPGALLAGVDLEEAGAIIAAREAVLDAADGEFLVARAHEGLARPFAAAVVVDRIDIVKARDKLARTSVSQVRAERFHQPSVVQPSASL